MTMSVVFVQNMDVQYEHQDKEFFVLKSTIGNGRERAGFLHVAISSPHSPMIMACSTHIYTADADPS